MASGDYRWVINIYSCLQIFFLFYKSYTVRHQRGILLKILERKKCKMPIMLVNISVSMSLCRFGYNYSKELFPF